jgi:hypothetical protein
MRIVLILCVVLSIPVLGCSVRARSPAAHQAAPGPHQRLTRQAGPPGCIDGCLYPQVGTCSAWWQTGSEVSSPPELGLSNPTRDNGAIVSSPFPGRKHAPTSGLSEWLVLVSQLVFICVISNQQRTEVRPARAARREVCVREHGDRNPQTGPIGRG